MTCVRIVLLSLICCVCSIPIISCRGKTKDVASVIHLTQVYKPEFVQDRVKPAVERRISDQKVMEYPTL